MNKLDKLIKKYGDLYEATINPDGATWEDLELDKDNRDGCTTPTEWLATHEDFDEGQQTSMCLYSEFVDDLKKLKK